MPPSHWLAAPEYWTAALLVRRGLGLVYALAFACAFDQFPALLGERGLMPVPRFTARVAFARAPSLFHFYYSDRALRTLAGAGCLLGAAAAAGLVDRLPLWAVVATWLVLYAAYLSIVNVGQTFYGFGWESLLLEAGLLAALLGNAEVAPTWPAVYLVRWLLFRLEFGAGLIKLRGDPCWRDLTCLDYHHETQPMPNPLSWYFHRLPRPLHRLEVLGNHVAQLVAPFALFAPQPAATCAGVAIVGTQCWLVASGNFSWLNATTIVLGLSAFDEAVLGFAWLRPAAPPVPPPAWYAGLVLAATVAVAVLSWWPVRNMLSRQQVMNYSFNPLHLVNTYGAFGSITRVRHEVVLECTEERTPGPETRWHEYEFKGKPGDPRRRPPQIAPYHLRLDWLMWFAALSDSYARGWLLPLMRRLLEADPATLRLLARAPFGDRRPGCVRALYYRYAFTTRAERRATGAWWTRELLGAYTPPLRLEGEALAIAAARPRGSSDGARGLPRPARCGGLQHDQRCGYECGLPEHGMCGFPSSDRPRAGLGALADASCIGRA